MIEVPLFLEFGAHFYVCWRLWVLRTKAQIVCVVGEESGIHTFGPVVLDFRAIVFGTVDWKFLFGADEATEK